MMNTLAVAIDLPDRLTADILDPGRVAALLDIVRREGIDVRVVREVHEWNGSTGMVTSHLTCIVDGGEITAVGVARERGEASMLAILSAVGSALC
ncbi:MAG: hypothetical protein WBL06_11685 [Pseudolysinimonas sp.]|jgi:hypothetical protein|uniref:hypothetical protein n=1 Tax=Pseudolysinimonas sp. TaxID=2680009 RepID=UPI003C73E881